MGVPCNIPLQDLHTEQFTVSFLRLQPALTGPSWPPPYSTYFLSWLDTLAIRRHHPLQIPHQKESKHWHRLSAWSYRTSRLTALGEAERPFPVFQFIGEHQQRPKNVTAACGLPPSPSSSRRIEFIERYQPQTSQLTPAD